MGSGSNRRAAEPIPGVGPMAKSVESQIRLTLGLAAVRKPEGLENTAVADVGSVGARIAP